MRESDKNHSPARGVEQAASSTSASTDASDDVARSTTEYADVWEGYGPDAVQPTEWDEAFRPSGDPREPYAHAMARFGALGLDELAQRHRRVTELTQEHGITYRVTGEDEPRVFPIDGFPRILTAELWATISAGLEQRARALNAFLDDIYGPQRIVEEGIVDAADLKRAPGYVDAGRLQPPGGVRAGICGMDLICTSDGEWLVLEDNLRVPSGIVFSHFLRTIETECFGDVMDGYDLHDPHEGFAMLRETLLAAVPQAAPNPDAPRLALVTMGESDSAWFEHKGIADLLDIPVCTPEQLAVRDGYLCHLDENGTAQTLDVVYARIEKDQLFTAEGFDGAPLGPGIEDALRNRRLTIANAFGNGIGDDKAIYARVPDMIRFYLDEEPLLPQVPTDLCHKPGKAEEVIERLGERVVKPVDGFGGSGITIGPECTQEELSERAEELLEHPERFIAQDIVRLSTLPTYARDAQGATCVHPRHVDLRVFVHVRPVTPSSRNPDAQSIDGQSMTAHTIPAALTRTAAAGSLIVNTSRGGGGKDTWILRAATQENV